MARVLGALIAVAALGFAGCASGTEAGFDGAAVDGAAVDGRSVDAAVDARPVDAAVDAAIDAPASVQRLGHPTPLGESSTHAPDFLLGEQLVVPTNLTLRQFGVLAISAGPLMKLALYTNAGGAPGTLVAQTAATAMVTGAMELAPTAGPVALPAGTYWFVGVYATGASIGYTTAAGTNVVQYRALPFGSALPSPFGAPLTYTGQSFNYYLVVE